MTQELIERLATFSVLYVEDEDGPRKNINEILEIFFNKIYLAKDGDEAYKIYMDKKPDLIITDIKIPKLNGIELIQKIRKTNSKIRIIVLSAHTDLEFMLQAVELHLVKYIVKPITESKLYDALQAFLDSFEGTRVYNINTSWIFDEGKSLVKGPNIEYNLTKKETIFLKLLLAKKRTITYQEMENAIWDEDHIMTPNAMRLFIKNLRKKLPPKILKNVQGIGYQIIS